MVLNMNGSEGNAFRLMVVYATTEPGRPDFFRHLEVFLRMPHTLILVGDWDGSLDAQKDFVDSVHSRRECKSLKNLLRSFQLSDRY